VSAASGEALGHLDQAITQLNVAIAEIRIFMEGLPRESVDIGDFTTELTALVHALNLPSSAKFEVTIEPKAVQCLTQEQALHLKYRERIHEELCAACSGQERAY